MASAQILTSGKALYAYNGTEWVPLNTSGNLVNSTRWQKVMSGGETSLSGNDDNGESLIYTPGFEQVFLNGVLLARDADYTATTGTTITGLSALTAGYIVEVIAYNNINVGNTYTQGQIDNKIANTFTRWVETLSASATVLSGLDDNSNTLSYTPGLEQVYVNGILLLPSEYTATSGSSVVLSEAAVSGDVIQIYTLKNFRVPNTYTIAQTDDQFLTKTSASNTYTPLSSPVTSFKNKVINGSFDIWQRGTSFSTNNVYTADRWVIVGASGQTVSVSRQSFTPGAAPVSGYEGTYFARMAWSGTPSGTFWFTQRIEDVRTLAGQTVTLSFWAKASSTTSAFTPMFEQNFGSGGSSVVSTTGSAITLTTSWQRFSQTFSIPSISGKTIGTNSYIEVRPFNGSTAVTGIDVDIWGVQVEKGSIATEYEQRFIGDELRMCQRYYYRNTPGNLNGNYCLAQVRSTTQVEPVIHFPVTMRTVPTSLEFSNLAILRAGISVTAITAATLPSDESTPNSAKIAATTNASGASAGQVVTVTNNNSTAGYLAFSAEL
jgi:hypothetical protein